MRKIYFLVSIFASLFALASKGHNESMNIVIDNVDNNSIYDLTNPCCCSNCVMIRNMGNVFYANNYSQDKIEDKVLKELVKVKKENI